MNREKFEARYAKARGLSVRWVHEHERFAIPCSCEERKCPGWRMTYDVGVEVQESIMEKEKEARYILRRLELGPYRLAALDLGSYVEQLDLYLGELRCELWRACTRVVDEYRGGVRVVPGTGRVSAEEYYTT